MKKLAMKKIISNLFFLNLLLLSSHTIAMQSKLFQYARTQGALKMAGETACWTIAGLWFARHGLDLPLAHDVDYVGALSSACTLGAIGGHIYQSSPRRLKRLQQELFFLPHEHPAAYELYAKYNDIISLKSHAFFTNASYYKSKPIDDIFAEDDAIIKTLIENYQHQKKQIFQDIPKIIPSLRKRIFYEAPYESGDYGSGWDLHHEPRYAFETIFEGSKGYESSDFLKKCKATELKALKQLSFFYYIALYRIRSQTK